MSSERIVFILSSIMFIVTFGIACAGISAREESIALFGLVLSLIFGFAAMFADSEHQKSKRSTW